MALQSNDLFVVQRGGELFKVPSSTLNSSYASTANVSIGPNPPSSPIVGDLWWSTLQGNLFILYQDVDSIQWIDASPAFVDIDYTRIFDYIDTSVQQNAVTQIRPADEITVSPSLGKGVVTIGADLSTIEQSIADLDTKFTNQIQNLEYIILDLVDRLDEIEDNISDINNIDGGYPNAEGIFNEDDVDGGDADSTSLTGDPIDGGDAEGYD